MCLKAIMKRKGLRARLIVSGLINQENHKTLAAAIAANLGFPSPFSSLPLLVLLI